MHLEKNAFSFQEITINEKNYFQNLECGALNVVSLFCIYLFIYFYNMPQNF